MDPIQASLAHALRSALGHEGLTEPERVPLERSSQPEHGDWSSSVALVTAGRAGRNPRDLAAALQRRIMLGPPPYVTKVDVAGPGFINFWLDDGWLHDTLTRVVSEGVERYAASDLGRGQRVNVEFVSANPTGPLHVGAGRWAAYGDSVCRLLSRCGHEAHREYYINDRGRQIDLFAASLAARKAGAELPEDAYRGQYITDWAGEMPDGADPGSWGHERVMNDLRSTLAAMNVHFDTWFSERSMVASDAISAALDDLRARGAVDEHDGAVWLRARDFGLAKDEVLVRSDGEPTYLLADIAYHRNKLERGFTHLIDIWGSDHHGHVERLKAGLWALGYDPEALEVLLGQLVTVQRGGQVVRMGKRSGDFVELAEVLEEVGPDVARLTFLLQSIGTRMVFDLDQVVSQSAENPVHYVQYAHARIASIGRRAAQAGVTRKPLPDVSLDLLASERELDLLRSLHELPEVVIDGCRTRSPHKVTTWVRELAGRFHGFYHDCRVLGEGVDPEMTQARLWLVEATRIGLAIGLDLLGASAPEMMESLDDPA